MNKRFGLGFLIVFLVLLVLSFWKVGIYKSELGLNLIVVGDLKVSILAIRPREGFVNWVDLPASLNIKVAENGSEYPVTSLWKLGQMNKRPKEMVKKNLSSTIGVPFARVIKVGKESSPEGLLGSLLSLRSETDLSWKDRYLLRRDLEEMVAGKRILENSVPENAFDKTFDPDGREVWNINSVISLWTKNKFLIEAILGESVSARVFNLSSERGAALNLSRQVEAVGVRVVEVTTSEERFEGKGCFFGVSNKKKFTLTHELLVNHLNCRERKNWSNGGGEEGITIWYL